MRAQTGALDSTVCEEQLPLPEGVASTAGPFRGMPNIERELSAWLDNRGSTMWSDVAIVRRPNGPSHPERDPVSS